MSAAAWLAGAVALAFAGAGVANLAGTGSVKADFAWWGYPAGFHRVAGACELADAALLLHPATRQAGSLLLGGVMVAALATLARHRAGWGHIAPAGVLAAGLFGVLVTA